MAFHQGGPRIAAVNPPAREAGLRPAQRLADARALVPDLVTTHADPAADLHLLETLAGWCERYTPWVAIDPLGGALVDSGIARDPLAAAVDDAATATFGGDAGLFLDVTGCGHLFGAGIEGERAMLADLTTRLAKHGFTARAAMADTPGAAWALARFAERQADLLSPPAAHRGLVSALPVEALRLDAAAAETLRRLGLRRAGDLYGLPRAPLARRFGEGLARRLDQALGLLDEPIQPRVPAPAFRTRLAFVEPVGRPEDIAAAASRLLAALCGQFEKAGVGARRLEIRLFRVDGTVDRAAIGTGRPSRDNPHLMKLFEEPLSTLDPGFGVELMMLSAAVVEPFVPEQAAMPVAAATVAAAARGGAFDLADAPAAGARDVDDGAVTRLVDRLAQRVGAGNVVRLAPAASHLPERAVALVAAGRPAARPGTWARVAGLKGARPTRLLSRPEPIDVTAPVPDDPPLLFRWRGAARRVARAEGPERLVDEWWRDAASADEARAAPAARDYYRVEDDDGHRFWVYRDGPFNRIAGTGATARWYLHGFCA
ncbi:MAG: DNA polymerase Y family protein [Rhodospirillales bacterium]|nr:MAG: DNA polymerase Y family protein [Rhodospirillales bacterium]